MPTGGAELRALARRLRKAGDKKLAQRMRRGLEKATGTLPADIRAAFRAAMPSGYEDTLDASMKVRTSVKTTGGDAAVSIIAEATGKTEPRHLDALNDGLLRHPIPAGRKHPWVNQKVPAGAFDKPIEAVSDKVTAQMEQVLRDVERDIMEG